MNHPLDPAIVDAAIAWSIRLQFGAARTEEAAAFEAWRTARPEHDEAWRRIQSVDGRFGDIAPSIGLKTLDRRRRSKGDRRGALKTLGLIAGGGVATWLASRSAPWERAVADYSTTVGERRTVALDDGTVLVLNTDTALNVRFDSTSRSIELVRGELCVTTGEDTHAAIHRPFLVQTAFGVLRPLGTRFFVRLENAGARLTVEQGAVEITVREGARAISQAGETYLFDSAGASRSDAAGLDADAWLDGILLAREMPLARFLAELARYRAGFISCTPEVAQRHVSGAYQTGDTDKALALVAASLGLTLRYRTRYWVTVAATDSKPNVS